MRKQAQIKFAFRVYQMLHMYRCEYKVQEYGKIGIEILNLSVKLLLPGAEAF